MTDHASLLRQLDIESEPLIEQWLDLADKFAGLRKRASDGGLDWSQAKALFKAKAQDRRSETGGTRHVKRIIDRADFASAYADMLGLGTKMNENNFSSELKKAIQPTNDGGRHEPRRLNLPDSRERPAPISLPPHDSETGEITETEPASGPLDAAAGQGAHWAEGASVAPPPIPKETAPVSGDAGEMQVIPNGTGASPIPQPAAGLPTPADASAVERIPPDVATAGAPFPEMPSFLDRRPVAA